MVLLFPLFPVMTLPLDAHPSISSSTLMRTSGEESLSMREVAWPSEEYPEDPVLLPLAGGRRIGLPALLWLRAFMMTFPPRYFGIFFSLDGCEGRMTVTDEGKKDWKDSI